MARTPGWSISDFMTFATHLQRKIIAAQAEAEAMKAEGFAEAQVMAAQGYNKKDVIQAEVQKAYAEGIGNMGSSGGGSVASDLVGVVAGMKAAGMAVENMGIFGNNPTNQPAPSATVCPSCGKPVAAGAKFCPECGTKIAAQNENEIICPQCGQKTVRGKFCSECGAPLIGKCPKCGADLQPGTKFCPECGEKL